MIEYKIREVMGLVDKYGNAVEDHARGSKGGADAENQAYAAIESKLRALLEEKQEPPWQSIDSAPKEDLILAFERRWCFAEWSVIHGGWFEEDAPVGGRLNPSHWMPIPPDPCN